MRPAYHRGSPEVLRKVCTRKWHRFGMGRKWNIWFSYCAANIGWTSHIYRSIEAHLVTLVALFTLYIQVVFSDEEKARLEVQINHVVSAFGSYADETTDYLPDTFQRQVTEVHQMLSANDIFGRLNEWKKQAKGISRFLTNYMDQVKNLLMFIAATRSCNWKLHFASMEELLPYFHAHDEYNYGRWGPLYVADMMELQITDPETWKFLDKGKFAITKHDVPFTAIDPDHGIEQEHKKMNIKGGFIGITGNESALQKCRNSKTMPELKQGSRVHYTMNLSDPKVISYLQMLQIL